LLAMAEPLKALAARAGSSVAGELVKPWPAS
jgi:hypothetical protein